MGIRQYIIELRACSLGLVGNKGIYYVGNFPLWPTNNQYVTGYRVGIVEVDVC